MSERCTAGRYDSLAWKPWVGGENGGDEELL